MFHEENKSQSCLGPAVRWTLAPTQLLLLVKGSLERGVGAHVPVPDRLAAVPPNRNTRRKSDPVTLLAPSSGLARQEALKRSGGGIKQVSSVFGSRGHALKD